ncbi:MAG: SigB/SigF/SigG family RNA polymerase sigma factor [Mycobacteriales bacterium]
MPAHDADHDVERDDIAAQFETLASLAPDDPTRVKVREEIINSQLGLARRIAARFRGRGIFDDDLEQVARLGLIRAVDRYNPDRGNTFIGFAIPTMLGELRRHFRDTGWSIHVPRQLQELHLEVDQAVSALTERDGRPPDLPAIAGYLNCSVERVQEGIEVGAAYQSSSLDSAPATDSPRAAAPVDLLPSEEDAIGKLVDREALRPLLAELSPRDRRVIYLRFFEGLAQSRIAAEVGVSQMQISRILSATLRRLREGLLAPPD